MSRVAHEQAGEAHKHTVARLVTQRIVDALEVVEVEAGQRDGAVVAAGVGNLDRGALLETATVQQPGQRIGARLGGQAAMADAVSARLR